MVHDSLWGSMYGGIRQCLDKAALQPCSGLFVFILVQVTNPAFHVTKNMEDFVTWVDTSKIKRKVLM